MTEWYRTRRAPQAAGCSLKIRTESGWRYLPPKVLTEKLPLFRTVQPADSFEADCSSILAIADGKEITMEVRQKDGSVWHEGELEVQRRAGVLEEARKMQGGIFPSMPAPAMRFLGEQQFAAFSSRDRQQRV